MASSSGGKKRSSSSKLPAIDMGLIQQMIAESVKSALALSAKSTPPPPKKSKKVLEETYFGEVIVVSSDEGGDSADDGGKEEEQPATPRAPTPPPPTPVSDHTYIRNNFLPIFQSARINYRAVANKLQEEHRRELKSIINHLCMFLADPKIGLTTSKDKVQ
jgi:hypothetical protein